MGAAGSVFHRVVVALADRLSGDPSIPERAREAFRANAVVVIEGELSKLFGGEQLRMYLPKLGCETRRARDARIAAALAAGEPTEVVAQRERVSERHARRVRGRFGGHFDP